jgi:hypothetical protein
MTMPHFSDPHDRPGETVVVPVDALAVILDFIELVLDDQWSDEEQAAYETLSRLCPKDVKT